MKLVLLGPPGAGKGTNAKVISEDLKLKHLATGDILRRHIKEQSELGKKAKDIIEKGGLVPDDLVNAMMEHEILAAGLLEKGFILDGYPRTVGQADSFGNFLNKHHAKLDAVLNFVTSEKVLIDRLSGRRVCGKCGANFHIRNIPPRKEGVCDHCGEALVQRKDDKPETIKNRLETYQKETSPLIEYYRKKQLLHDLPADKNLHDMQKDLKQLFDKLG